MRQRTHAFSLLLILATVGCSGGGSKPVAEQSAQSTPPEVPPQAPVAATSKFVVLDEKVSDAPIKTQIVQNIVVEGVPTKAELETEIMNRYRAALARRGFRYHNPATNIFIYVYGTREQARAGQGLWIGMIGKGFGDKQEPRVTISQDRLVALTQKPEERFGLSEAIRKLVYQDIASAEDRGTREAMARVPDSRIMEQVKLENQLQGKYKGEIAREHKLSDDQMDKIVIEGVTKGWPAPLKREGN